MTLGYTLDRTGTIRGLVRLEGTDNHADSIVTLSLWDTDAGAYTAVGTPATTNVSGTFDAGSLTAGTYALEVTHAGYTTRRVENLTLGQGEVLLVPEISLLIGKGDLEGTVTLAGESAHDGIRVEATSGHVTYTDASGHYLFVGLAVGDYLPTASKGLAYQAATVATLATVTEGVRTTAAALELQPVRTATGKRLSWLRPMQSFSSCRRHSPPPSVRAAAIRWRSATAPRPSG